MLKEVIVRIDLFIALRQKSQFILAKSALQALCLEDFSKASVGKPWLM